MCENQLVNKPLKEPIICPHCNNENSCPISIEGVVSRIRKFDGFLCFYCLNTGRNQFPEGKTLGSYMQWEDSIVEIIKATGMGDPKVWYKYVSSIPAKVDSEFFNTQITISLHCNKGHELCHTLRKWQTILLSKKRQKMDRYCDVCNPIKQGKGLSDQEHLDRLRQFHPEAEFLDPEISALTRADCGEKSVVGNFEIMHPSFVVNIKKMKDRCKTKQFGEFSYCLCCSEEKKWAIPGGDKTIEQLTARLRIRAAYVATLLKDSSIDTVTISAEEKKLSPCDIVKTSEPLLFHCHKSTHSPSTPICYGKLFQSS